ncbi:MAG: aminoacyl-tRNA hydrolase [Opitutaceae bacterium]|nr:aminoacyl-tRNA hydrolase [Cytophagales bacterium]
MANFLIIGLGNPGPEYEFTRHNIGFLVLDNLAAQKQVNFSPDRYGLRAEFKYAGKNFTLIKPNTFMNLSGKAVSYWLSQSKIPLENLLVVTDDLALPFGKIRMRPQGSHGGHNGLRNIQEILNSEKYTRLRIGVGNEFEKGKQVDYVLSNFDKAESENMSELLTKCSDCIISFARNGLAMTMNQFNK